MPKKVRKSIFLDFVGYFSRLFSRPLKRPFLRIFCAFGPGDSCKWRPGSQDTHLKVGVFHVLASCLLLCLCLFLPWFFIFPSISWHLETQNGCWVIAFSFFLSLLDTYVHAFTNWSAACCLSGSFHSWLLILLFPITCGLFLIILLPYVPLLPPLSHDGAAPGSPFLTHAAPRHDYHGVAPALEWNPKWPTKRCYRLKLISAPGKWGRTQMGSDGFNRILTGLYFFNPVRVRLVPLETHDFKGFWPDFNRILTGL